MASTMNFRKPSVCSTAEASRVHPRGDSRTGGERIRICTQTCTAVIAVRVQIDEAGGDEQACGVDHIAPAIGGNVVFDGGDLVAGDADVGSPLHASRRIEYGSTANHEVESAAAGECRSSTGAKKDVADSFLVHYSSIQPVLTSTRTQMGSARRWSIVVLLCLGMVIAYVDRTALSVAIAVPDFRNHFGLTDSQRGLMNSAFFWSYALLAGSGRMAG